MKKIIYVLFILIAIGLISCQEKVDIEAEKEAIENMITEFLDGMNNQDVEKMASFIQEDALVCGTDPSEFWNKENIIEIWKEMLAESPIELNFFGEKIIKIASDGNSAIAVEQFFIPIYSPNIAWRNVYSLTKSEGKWMISFWSTALIPKNEDLGTINKALTVEETIQ